MSQWHLLRRSCFLIEMSVVYFVFNRKCKGRETGVVPQRSWLADGAL